jgi:hypothetical protein
MLAGGISFVRPRAEAVSEATGANHAEHDPSPARNGYARARIAGLMQDPQDADIRCRKCPEDERQPSHPPRSVRPRFVPSAFRPKRHATWFAWRASTPVLPIAPMWCIRQDASAFVPAGVELVDQCDRRQSQVRQISVDAAIPMPAATNTSNPTSKAMPNIRQRGSEWRTIPSSGLKAQAPSAPARTQTARAVSARCMSSLSPRHASLTTRATRSSSVAAIDAQYGLRAVLDSTRGCGSDRMSALRTRDRSGPWHMPELRPGQGWRGLRV